MVTSTRRSGFTLVELLVVIAIIGTLVGLLFPAIGAVRELAKKAACTSNMRQLFFGLEGFENANRRYPPSCKYARGSSTNSTKYESWSWIALLLPYIGGGSTYDLLTIKNGVPWAEPALSKSARNTTEQVEKHKMARETIIRELLCASRSGDTEFEGAPAKGFKTDEKDSVKGALTSYKAMGATVHESLPFKILGTNSTGSGTGQGSSVVRSTATPPYGDKSDHPDGVMFPAEEGIRRNDIVDGEAQTIMLAETLEEKYARWIFGTEATLVGLPSEDDPAKCGVKIVNNTAYGHYAPTGWDGKFDGDSGIDADVRTYLKYDYSQITNKYDNEVGIKYGPSSRHPSVVNHLFCDGQVRSLALDIDVAAYMFMITRKGNEKVQKWMTDHGY